MTRNISASSGLRWTKDNQPLVDASDVVIPSVRPDQFQDMAVDAKWQTCGLGHGESTCFRHPAAGWLRACRAFDLQRRGRDRTLLHALVRHGRRLDRRQVDCPRSFRGLSPEFALRAAKGVVVQASQFLAGDDVDPSSIVQEMIDYRGTTCTALQTMIDLGFGKAVSVGLEAVSVKAAMMKKQFAPILPAQAFVHP